MTTEQQTSQVRRFKVRHADDNEIVLEIDPAVLTLDVAAEINAFNGPRVASFRLHDQGGDLLATVARLFGGCAMFCATADGGAEISEGDTEAAQSLVKSTLDGEAEGWPNFESLGIRIVSAHVDAPTYYSVMLEAL